jgi:WD40 repeat protein/tRNA A-37 threonylcarbamoyl transferase component Bud32
MSEPDPHPSDPLLRAFDRGSLDAVQQGVVEGHLGRCEQCSSRLKTLREDPALTPLQPASMVTEATPGPPELPTQDRTVQCKDVPGRSGTPLLPELADHPRYRILEPLAAGGMGTVFRAEHRLMQRVIALKVVRRDLTDSPNAVERFRQEVRSAARLCHPNIVTAYDADQAGDMHFLVMEYVEGNDLGKLIKQHGPLPVGQACEYVRQAALGLQHAFEKGLVHRDLKPANLLLTGAGQVKILDFGLARLIQETVPADDGVTPSGVVVGTPDYIAPEQARSPHQADIRADIYSLGCTLYALLAGRPPFASGTALQKLIAHREERPRPLTDLRNDLPPGLVSAVDRMLAKDAAQRWQTPAEVAAVLAPFARGDAGPAGTVTARPARALRWWLTAAAGLLVVTGVGLGTWLYLANLSAPEQPAAPVAGRELGPLDLKAGPLTCVAFSRDGRMALAAGADFSLRLWDLEARKELGRLVGHTAAVRGISFAPDGKRAISGGIDTTVRLWDLTKMSALRTFAWHASWVRDACFCPDGLHAVTCGNDALMVQGDTDTGAMREFPGHLKVVRCVAVSHNGRIGASGSWDQTIRTWDLIGGGLLHTFEGHTKVVNAAVFSTDDKHLLTGSEDETVRLWDLASNKEARRFPGHTSSVLCVALSADGRLAAAGANDGCIRLWAVSTGKELCCLERHKGPVVAVAFLPDCHRLYSGGQDGTIRLWQVPGLERQ